MERSLDSKLVVITGGAEGIGFSIADQFLEHGARVVILDIHESKGVESSEDLKLKYGDGRVEFIKCDVTKDLEAVSNKIFNKYERVDVLVNNAGTVDEYNIRNTLEVNTIALIEWTMKFREHMRKDKGGKGGTIINVASIYGYIINEYLVFYKASKFAVMGFSRSLGHENNYKAHGVRIIVICPGFTHTTLSAKKLCWDEHHEQFRKFAMSQPWQKADAVGIVVVELFKSADSGTAWSIEGGGATEITA